MTGHGASMGWNALIFPQLEQQALYDGIKVGEIALEEAVSVRFVSETIDGRFNASGVGTDPTGATTAATRAVVDTTWERLHCRRDEQPIGQW